jgi:hypothetical protein
MAGDRVWIAGSAGGVVSEEGQGLGLWEPAGATGAREKGKVMLEKWEKSEIRKKW